jgi:hypothetical protein
MAGKRPSMEQPGERTSQRRLPPRRGRWRTPGGPCGSAERNQRVPRNHRRRALGGGVPGGRGSGPPVAWSRTVASPQRSISPSTASATSTDRSGRPQISAASSPRPTSAAAAARYHLLHDRGTRLHGMVRPHLSPRPRAGPRLRRLVGRVGPHGRHSSRAVMKHGPMSGPGRPGRSKNPRAGDQANNPARSERR